MRAGVRCGLVVAALLAAAAGCSSAPGTPFGGAADENAACELIGDLARPAADLAAVDLADPAASQAAIEAAIEQVAATPEDLAAEVPADVRDDVEAMQRAVEQYRFEEALTARAAIDDYAARECE